MIVRAGHLADAVHRVLGVADVDGDYAELGRGHAPDRAAAPGLDAIPRHAESAVSWQPFSPAALTAATQAGKPAVVDFTAAWCLPCRENDKVTFTDPDVGAAADRFVMLRAAEGPAYWTSPAPAVCLRLTANYAHNVNDQLALLIVRNGAFVDRLPRTPQRPQAQSPVS